MTDFRKIQFQEKHQILLLIIGKTVCLIFLGMMVRPIYAQDTPVNSDQIRAEVETIYFRLVDAIGHDHTKRIPEITVVLNRMTVSAHYNQVQNTIYIEMTLCQMIKSKIPEYFEEAIALVLGHELGHFFAENECQDAFGVIGSGEFSRVEWNFPEDELRADYFAGFAAYMAMYTDAIDCFEQLLELVYSMYKIEWPLLEDRKQMADSVQQDIRKLIMVFETGNLLTLLNSPFEAGICYQHILKRFESREIYNNLSVAYLRLAFEYLEHDMQRYVYPFELDAHTRLYTNIRKPYYPDRDSAEKYLGLAMSMLHEAVRQDTLYYEGFVNLACTYILMGELRSAYDLIEFISGRKDSPTQLNDTFTTLKGLAKAMEGKEKEARYLLEKTKANATDSVCRVIASQNLAVVNKVTGNKKKVYEEPILCTIGNFDIKQYLTVDFFQYITIGKHSRLYFSVLEDKSTLLSFNHHFIFHIPYSQEPLVCNDLRVGIDIELLVRRWGLPMRVVSGNLGTYTYYQYHKSNLLILTKKGKIKNWLIYYIP